MIPRSKGIIKGIRTIFGQYLIKILARAFWSSPFRRTMEFTLFGHCLTGLNRCQVDSGFAFGLVR